MHTPEPEAPSSSDFGDESEFLECDERASGGCKGDIALFC